MAFNRCPMCGNMNVAVPLTPHTAKRCQRCGYEF